MSFQWFPERLNAAIARAYEVSMQATARAADAAGGASSGAVLVGNTLRPTGIGAIQEEGARPHEIKPTKNVLYLKGLNIFVSGPVHHPGRAPQPYLHPAAAAWANGGFQGTARVSLAEAGYR